jgi:hypothetical protein
VSTFNYSGGTASASVAYTTTTIAVAPPTPEPGLHHDSPALPLDPFVGAALAAGCVYVAARVRVSLREQRVVGVP